MMAERGEPVAQLATRIPKSLHHKLHCVERGIQIMEVVTAAIERSFAGPAVGDGQAEIRTSVNEQR